MIKKDYELIAEILTKIPDDTVRNALAQQFSSELTKENPRFAKDKFLEACGIKQ